MSSARLHSLPDRGKRLSSGRQSLAERRRKKRRRSFIAYVLLILILFGVAVWWLRQDVVRISQVNIFGADQSLATIATRAMQGDYLGIIPCDSTFFFPASRIRASILAACPEIAAVSLSRNGLTGISIKVDDRVPVARWCGAPPAGGFGFSTSTPDLNTEDCYFFDANGFVYATTSMASPINSFIVYESLLNDVSPIGSTLPNAEKFPPAFDFARQLGTFGSPVDYVVFRADEVDDYLASGTRITYVLGDEQNAYTALVSARNNFNLTDGSIEYIDLRFDGKMYLKKKE
ncbi:MAG: hypothetical protein ABSB00_00950 [Minisyncoccia bacterium]|jgi:hypothetical protein